MGTSKALLSTGERAMGDLLGECFGVRVKPELLRSLEATQDAVAGNTEVSGDHGRIESAAADGHIADEGARPDGGGAVAVALYLCAF